MNKILNPSVAAVSYLLAIVHLAISFGYLDMLSSIGLGNVTSNLLALYATGDFLILSGFMLRFFRRDMRVLVSVLCAILSLPFLGYRLAPELFQSLIGGYWALAGKYMQPDLMAGVDLAVIFSLVVACALSRLFLAKTEAVPEIS